MPPHVPATDGAPSNALPTAFKVLDSAPFAFALLDSELRVQFYSASMTQLFALTEKDLGRPLADLAPRFSDPDFFSDAAQLIAGAGSILRLVQAGDQWFQRVIVHAADRGAAVAVFFYPVTELVTAAETSSRERRRFQDAFELSARPSAIVDHDLRVVGANRAYRDLFVPHRSPPEGEPLLAHPGPVRSETAELHSKLRDGMFGPTEVEIDLGGPHRFRVHAKELPSREGEHGLALIEFEDMTDAATVESTLRAIAHDTNYRNARNVLLLRTASHDLIQPIQVIRLMQSMLFKKAAGAVPASLMARLDDDLRSVSDMLSTINEILLLERTDQGRANNPAQFALAPVFARLRERCQRLVREHDTELRVLTASAQVVGSPRMLEQLIANLTFMALRFAPGRKIVVGARRRRDAIEVLVAHTGSGEPDATAWAMLPNDEFALEPTPATVEPDGGFHFALAYCIAHAIGVNLTQRQGTSSHAYSFLIPRVEAVSGTKTRDRHASRVLIVDGDSQNAASMQVLLTDIGYSVRHYNSISDAVCDVERGNFEPDLVVADNPPGEDIIGLRSVLAIRAALGRPLPAIILSATATPELSARLAAAGCLRLAKPVNPNFLGYMVRNLLASPAPSGHQEPEGANATVQPQRWTVYFVGADARAATVAAAALDVTGFDVRVFSTYDSFRAAYQRGENRCVAVDLHGIGMACEQAIEALRAAGVESPIILICPDRDPATLMAAARTGATAVISKEILVDELISAIGLAMKESRELAPMAEQASPVETVESGRGLLTSRQREVMALVVAGLSNKEIATRLNVSVRTAENHRAAVMRKLNVHTVQELVRRAQEEALWSQEPFAL